MPELDDLMQMTHPDIDAAPATTTERAFRMVWEHRGWERADPATLAAAGVLGVEVPDLKGLKKAELLEVAANLGLDGVDKSWRNDEIVAAIQEAASTPEADTTQED